MTAAPRSFWTDERCRRFDEMEARGASMNQIARELGASRSAIAGRRKRLRDGAALASISLPNPDWNPCWTTHPMAVPSDLASAWCAAEIGGDRNWLAALSVAIFLRSAGAIEIAEQPAVVAAPQETTALAAKDAQQTAAASASTGESHEVVIPAAQPTEGRPEPETRVAPKPAQPVHLPKPDVSAAIARHAADILALLRAIRERHGPVYKIRLKNIAMKVGLDVPMARTAMFSLNSGREVEIQEPVKGEVEYRVSFRRTA